MTAAEKMVDEVRMAGLKLTPQRMAIIRALADDPTHPTAQELFDRLHEELPTMSFATVYNTLAAFAAAGLCSARSLTRGPARFDPNTEPHDHAVCDACGLILDVDRQGSSVDPTMPTRAAPPFRGTRREFTVRAVERVYRGLCASCS